MEGRTDGRKDVGIEKTKVKANGKYRKGKKGERKEIKSTILCKSFV